MRKAYLVSPHMDKGYTLMIFHNFSSDHSILREVQTLNDKMYAHIFIQCRTANEIHVEFWTHDQELILEYCETLCAALNAQLELLNIQDITLKLLKESRLEWHD